MSAPTLEKYRTWLQDSVCPVVRAWCPNAGQRWYQEAATQFAQRTTDDDASRRYAEACPVPGADHTLYRLREVTLPCGASVLAGVHFRAMSTHFPFVGVFAQSRWLTETEVALAHEALMREFSLFFPQASWWWSWADRDRLTLASFSPDQYLVMGLLDEIRATPASSLPAGWTLRPIESAGEIGEAFAGLYREFHQAVPELAQAVGPANIDALEDCAKAGGLCACFEGTSLVGAVATKPDTRYGVNAWLMWDIVLARKHCGKGLAPALQRAVLDQLDTAHAPLVVGTIDANNAPSLRTALRVGRQIVGTWSFVRS